jgi:putative peptide zinc metalloprotease protein
MTGTATGQGSMAGQPTIEVGPASVLCLHALSVTPQAGSFVVGRADTGRFVALPEVGVAALELLAAGQTVAQATLAVTPPSASEPVDVLAFARSLVGLGFVRTVDDCVAPGLPARLSGVGVTVRPRLRWLFSRPMALAAAGCGMGALALMTTLPAVRPHALDVFFLRNPAASLAVLTLVTYALAAVHELAHVLSAAALGVPARLRITRRLYFLTFETNLTGLWALPPRKRVGPLLAGLGFDAVMLFGVLVLRAADVGPDRFLAAIALIELSAIVTQFFVFLRTDVYSVMTALLGCTNLSETTRLMLRGTIRRLSPEQQATLSASRPRDLAVARWYRIVHLAGMGLALWFFLAYFVPSTWHLLDWMRQALTTSGPASMQFYDALALGIVLLSPRLLTLAVAIRDAADRLRRHARPTVEPEASVARTRRRPRRRPRSGRGD